MSSIHPRSIKLHVSLDGKFLFTLDDLARAEAQVLAECARHPDPNERMRAASSQTTPAESLSYLRRDLHPHVRLRVADNICTPAEDFVVLAEDSDPQVRAAVLNNPSTPPLVKIWMRGGYGDMSLKEFLETANAD